MKKVDIEKVLRGEKTTVRICGYLYDIDLRDCVALVPRHKGSVAYECNDFSAYHYTHGGRVYCDAVRIASAISVAKREKAGCEIHENCQE